MYILKKDNVERITENKENADKLIKDGYILVKNKTKTKKAAGGEDNGTA